MILPYRDNNNQCVLVSKCHYLQSVHNEMAISCKLDAYGYYILAIEGRSTVLYSIRPVPSYQRKTVQEEKSLMNIDDAFRKIILVGGSVKPWHTEEGVLIAGILDFLLTPKIIYQQSRVDRSAAVLGVLSIHGEQIDVKPSFFDALVVLTELGCRLNLKHIT